MLHRREGINLLPVGKDDDAARMLSGGLPDIRNADGQALDLGPPSVLSLLLKVIHDIAVRRLGGQAGHGSRAEGLPRAEDHLRVLMRLGLVLTREIKVDIRLLVPLKAKERLKGNVKAKLQKLRSALRALPVRHVAARHAVKLPHQL